MQTMQEHDPFTNLWQDVESADIGDFSGAIDDAVNPMCTLKEMTIVEEMVQ